MVAAVDEKGCCPKCKSGPHGTGTSPDMNAIGCIWVYKAKLKQDGSLERIKAQLVAKRFSQVDGINFLETFLLVLEVVKGRDIQHSSCTQLESTGSSLSWDISSPSRSCVFFITF